MFRKYGRVLNILVLYLTNQLPTSPNLAIKAATAKNLRKTTS